MPPSTSELIVVDADLWFADDDAREEQRDDAASRARLALKTEDLREWARVLKLPGLPVETLAGALELRADNPIRTKTKRDKEQDRRSSTPIRVGRVEARS